MWPFLTWLLRDFLLQYIFPQSHSAATLLSVCNFSDLLVVNVCPQYSHDSIGCSAKKCAHSFLKLQKTFSHFLHLFKSCLMRVSRCLKRESKHLNVCSQSTHLWEGDPWTLFKCLSKLSLRVNCFPHSWQVALGELSSSVTWSFLCLSIWYLFAKVLKQISHSIFCFWRGFGDSCLKVISLTACSERFSWNLQYLQPKCQTWSWNLSWFNWWVVQFKQLQSLLAGTLQTGWRWEHSKHGHGTAHREFKQGYIILLVFRQKAGPYSHFSWIDFKAVRGTLSPTKSSDLSLDNLKMKHFLSSSDSLFFSPTSSLKVRSLKSAQNFNDIGRPVRIWNENLRYILLSKTLFFCSRYGLWSSGLSR